VSATTQLFDGILPFVRVAETRSFRRAAETLGVTTAAVSKSVRRLETDLGVALLVRTSRSVSVTPEGEAFLAACRDAVGVLGAARAAAQESRRKPRGEVHLTCSPILGPLLVRALGRLVERHPALTFRLTITDRLLRLVEEGIDVAVRLGAPEDSSLLGRPLWTPRWVTVASPRYLATHPAPATPAELAEHACLRFVGPNGRPRAFTFLDRDRRTPLTVPVDGPLLVDHGERLVDGALAGMGICQVLDFMVEDAIAAGRLVEVLAPVAAPGPGVHALFARERSRSANVRATVAFLAEQLGRRAARTDR
jgi:DNA-binding transcriptional LysR family regulator